MRILLDMDGIVADYFTAAKATFFWPGARPWPDGQYDCPSVFGIDKELYHQTIHEIDDWWLNLSLMHDAQQIVDLVYSFDEDFHFCTQPTVKPSGTTCASQKIQWLEKHFPVHKERFIITKDKTKLMVGTNYLLIDDCDNRVINHNCFLYPRQWNSKWNIASGLASLEAWLRCQYYT